MKNTLLKRLILLLTVFSVAFSLESPVFAEDTNYSFNEACILLNGLGFADVTEKADEFITRDELIKMLVKCSHYENSDESALPDMGIYADTNYYFLPDNHVTFENALKFCVKILVCGGKSASDAELLTLASRLDLYNGMNCSASDMLTYENAYILIHNFLKADISTCPNRFTVGGTSLLADKYKVSLVTGIVDAVGTYRLNGPAVSDGKISISGNLYSYNAKNEELFGKYVNAYVQKDGSKKTIIAISETGDSRVYKILPENDAVYENNVFSYYDNANKEYSVKISKKANVYYNGAIYPLENGTKLPESGRVTIIDNRCYNDGADIVLIESADIKKIMGLSGSNEIVYTLGASFNLSDISGTRLNDSTGAPIGFSDLEMGDIVSFYQDEAGNMWKAVKLTETVSGTVSEVSSNELTVNGISYRLLSEFSGNISSYLGEGLTLTLDEYGTIVYIRDGIMESQSVGIIIACGHYKNGLEEALSVKIFDTNGEVVTYVAGEKLSVNNVSYDRLDMAYEAVPKIGSNVKQSIVTYTINADGILTSVNFPSDTMMDAQSEAGLYKTAYDNDSDGEVAYKKDRDRLGNGIFVESSTLLFRIPIQTASGELADDMDYYSVSKVTSHADATEWSAKMTTGWSTDKEDKVADYVVIEYNAGTGEVASGIGNDTRVSMVESVFTVINSVGEVVEAAKIYNDKERQGVIVYGKTENFFTEKNIGAGDIVRVTYTSVNKNAGDAELVYKKGSSSLVKTKADNPYLYNGAGGGVNGKCEIRLCRVYKSWGKVIDIVYPSVDLSAVKDSDIKCIKSDTYFVARYDERTKTVKASSINDIYNYSIAGENCSWVVMYDRWNDSRCLYIVK